MSDEVGQPLPTDDEDERPTSARDKKLLNVSPLTRTIAGRLRTARLTRSMTQQELVAGTTFSKGYISAIECGRVTPSLHTLAQLAERLEVSLAYLLGEVEQDLELLKYDRDLLRLDSGAHPHDVPRAVQQRLIQVKACLLAGNWREAMQFLGEGDAPPNTMAQLLLVDWHWLTGWALLVQGRPRDALPRLQDGLKLAERLHARLPNAWQARLAEGVVWLSHFLGSAWCALGQTSLAYDYHQRCREAIVAGTVTDPELKLLSYTGLGRDALVLGRLEESISAYKDAVRQAEELHAPRQRGLAYWGLGLAYQTKEDFYRAKASYRQALEALNKHEDIQLLARVRNLLGHVLVHLGEWKQAEREFRFSLEVVRSLEDYHTWGYILGNLAELYGAKGDWEEAMEAARVGVKIAEKSGDVHNQGQLQLRLADAYTATHDLVAAEEALQKAMGIFQELADYRLLRETRARYAELLKQQGRFEEAYEQVRLELASRSGRAQ